nr:hypothetical protein [Tanacetum cinerariifolium]
FAGAGGDQGRNAVEDRAAHGQSGHDDGPDPGRGARSGGGCPIDAGRRGQAGTVAAAGRQLPVSAPRPEDHAPGLPHLRRWLSEPQRRGGATVG